VSRKRQITSIAVQRQKDRRRYEKIIDRYLRDCYALRTVARVSELAELLAAPRPYLSRVIPRLFGKSLREVLRERQLAEAQRLLDVASTLDLDAIAAASAFGHRSTFFRLFRAAFGMTPSEYRARRIRQ
jgi:AraC-like DNA-binding protein